MDYLSRIVDVLYPDPKWIVFLKYMLVKSKLWIYPKKTEMML